MGRQLRRLSSIWRRLMQSPKRNPRRKKVEITLSSMCRQTTQLCWTLGQASTTRPATPLTTGASCRTNTLWGDVLDEFSLLGFLIDYHPKPCQNVICKWVQGTFVNTTVPLNMTVIHNYLEVLQHLCLETEILLLLTNC